MISYAIVKCNLIIYLNVLENFFKLNLKVKFLSVHNFKFLIFLYFFYIKTSTKQIEVHKYLVEIIIIFGIIDIITVDIITY